MSRKNKHFIYLLSLLLLTACANWNVDDLATQEISPALFSTDLAQSTSENATVTATPFQPMDDPIALFFSNAIPMEWVRLNTETPITDEIDEADLIFSTSAPTDGQIIGASFQRIYTIVAPFDTVIDGIRIQDLQTVWQGDITNEGFSSLVMDDQTYKTLREIWGSGSSQFVTIVPKDEIISQVWKNDGTWAIIPFEEIEPRYKVIRVNGISPFDRPMDVENYPLTVKYWIYGDPTAMQQSTTQIYQLVNQIPFTNRDETKMTVVIMTGTTALARVALWKIDHNSLDYPIEKVKDWFLSADLRHVSNEVSFNADCDYDDPYTMQFCSKPEHIKVLEGIGINVVESTGNHMLDYGVEAFEKTLSMYEERGWLSYGGGFNAEQAKQPATTEINGNKIAFIGCNSTEAGPSSVWATETKAGAAKCDYDWFYQKISELKSQGYVVIATYQETEIDLHMYDEHYRTPFKAAALAGADIVQGSQAHMAMGFEFVDGHLIHYGLGNFLFDQVQENYIQEFYDRHIIYDGKYMGTELLTATLTDASRPVPMTEDERSSFLQEIFDASDMR